MAELEVLSAMSDMDINTFDIPEIMEFSKPRRGMFSGSPIRRAVQIRELGVVSRSNTNLQTDPGRQIDEQT